MNKYIPLLILLFIISCTSTPVQYNEDYRSGTEGVVVSFLEDRTVFYDQQYLHLNLFLQNKGAYDNPGGKIVLSGYDPSVLHISSFPIDFPDEFPGKNQYTETGAEYFIQVEEDAPVSLSLGDSYETTLQASICYNYQSIATPLVCLLYYPEDTTICQQTPISLSSQGGPVAVTEVQQAYMQDQVRFTVRVEHLGDGSVVNAYDMDAYDACPFGLTKDQLNHVGVTMEINGLDKPSCVPSSGYITLNDAGQGIVICTFTLREQKSYVTPMKITLDYGYLSVIEQELLVAESSSTVDREEGSYGPDDGSSSGGSGSGSGSGAGGDCYCSDANMKKWGGCVCLYLNGQMYYCSEGTTAIPTGAAAGSTITYEVHGMSTVHQCGDSAHPSGSCPFTGTTTVPKKLSIYGTVDDGRTVSERCDLRSS